MARLSPWPPAGLPPNCVNHGGFGPPTPDPGIRSSSPWAHGTPAAMCPSPPSRSGGCAIAESGRTGGGSPDHHDQQILKPKTACVRRREIPFLAVGEKGCAWHLDRVRTSPDRSIWIKIPLIVRVGSETEHKGDRVRPAASTGSTSSVFVGMTRPCPLAGRLQQAPSLEGGVPSFSSLCLLTPQLDHSIP